MGGHCRRAAVRRPRLELGRDERQHRRRHPPDEHRRRGPEPVRGRAAGGGQAQCEHADRGCEHRRGRWLPGGLSRRSRVYRRHRRGRRHGRGRLRRRGLAGYAAGAYVAEVNAQAAGQQADLQDRIDAANADAARYREAANAAERTVAELRTEIGSLNRRYAANQITAAEYADQLDNVETSALSLRVLIGESLGNIQVMEQDIAALEQNGRDTSALKQRLATLRRENERLVAQYDDLAQVVDLVPAEIDAPSVPTREVA
jgi:cell division protein FtsB